MFICGKRHKPEDSEFTNTQREIAMNPRYMPHFKVRQVFFIVKVKLNCLMHVVK
jgi:hypothetical protein